MQADPVEIRQEFAQIEALSESSGWKWMQEQLVMRSNSLLAHWMKGGHDLSTHERLAGQISLIGEILDLPQARASELSASMHESITKPAMEESDPVDRDPMSPVPDEPSYDYRGA